MFLILDLRIIVAVLVYAKKKNIDEIISSKSISKPKVMYRNIVISTNKDNTSLQNNG